MIIAIYNVNSLVIKKEKENNMNPEASLGVTQLLIGLMSGVALLLWSLGLVRTIMKKAYGGKLTYFVSHRFTGVLSSFWLGILITLVL